MPTITAASVSVNPLKDYRNTKNTYSVFLKEQQIIDIDRAEHVRKDWKFGFSQEIARSCNVGIKEGKDVKFYADGYYTGTELPPAHPTPATILRYRNFSFMPIVEIVSDEHPKGIIKLHEQHPLRRANERVLHMMNLQLEDVTAALLGTEPIPSVNSAAWGKYSIAYTSSPENRAKYNSESAFRSSLVEARDKKLENNEDITDIAIGYFGKYSPDLLISPKATYHTFLECLEKTVVNTIPNYGNMRRFMLKNRVYQATYSMNGYVHRERFGNIADDLSIGTPDYRVGHGKIEVILEEDDPFILNLGVTLHSDYYLSYYSKEFLSVKPAEAGYADIDGDGIPDVVDSYYGGTSYGTDADDDGILDDYDISIDEDETDHKAKNPAFGSPSAVGTPYYSREHNWEYYEDINQYDIVPSKKVRVVIKVQVTPTKYRELILIDLNQQTVIEGKDTIRLGTSGRQEPSEDQMTWTESYIAESFIPLTKKSMLKVRTFDRARLIDETKAHFIQAVSHTYVPWYRYYLSYIVIIITVIYIALSEDATIGSLLWSFAKSLVVSAAIDEIVERLVDAGIITDDRVAAIVTVVATALVAGDTSSSVSATWATTAVRVVEATGKVFQKELLLENRDYKKRMEELAEENAKILNGEVGLDYSYANVERIARRLRNMLEETEQPLLETTDEFLRRVLDTDPQIKQLGVPDEHRPVSLL